MRTWCEADRKKVRRRQMNYTRGKMGSLVSFAKCDNAKNEIGN
jgi:hypothetical protein